MIFGLFLSICVFKCIPCGQLCNTQLAFLKKCNELSVFFSEIILKDGFIGKNIKRASNMVRPYWLKVLQIKILCTALLFFIKLTLWRLLVYLAFLAEVEDIETPCLLLSVHMSNRLSVCLSVQMSLSRRDLSYYQQQTIETFQLDRFFTTTSTRGNVGDFSQILTFTILYVMLSVQPPSLDRFRERIKCHNEHIRIFFRRISTLLVWPDTQN